MPHALAGARRRDASPFRSQRVVGATLVAVPALFDALAERLRAFETLYAWAEAAPQPRALQGRGVVYIAELADCNTTLAVRHAWHGGLFAPLTGDRFLVPTRAPREAAVSLTLQARGIGTPELLAYALYPAGPGMRRVDVCTRYVANAWDFGAVLSGVAHGLERGAAERATVELLGQLARAGVVHPDLNVKNVLLVPGSAPTPEAWLLDVDVVQFHNGPSLPIMHRNLRRLTRSIRKWHSRHEIPVDDTWLASFSASCLSTVR